MQDMGVLSDYALQVTRYDSWLVIGVLCRGSAWVFDIGGGRMYSIRGLLHLSTSERNCLGINKNTHKFWMLKGSGL